MKPDEIEFRNLMFARCMRVDTRTGVYPRQLIEECGFNAKRAHYILTKMEREGIYEIGHVIDQGWITEKGLAHIAAAAAIKSVPLK